MAKGERLKCPDCKRWMVETTTSLHHELKGIWFDVDNVPAHVCRHCGHVSIPGPTARQLSQLLMDLLKVLPPQRGKRMKVRRLAVSVRV